jgi:Family of unknown function (DUF6526)
MQTQSYATHRNRPILTNAGALCILISLAAFVLRWFEIGGRYTMGLGLLGLVGAVMTLLAISRIYVTRLQDRIIKLEMKMRLAALLTPAQQALSPNLTKRQIIALRFASDEELPGLLERAAAERLSADQIKRAIRNWVPDWDRT